MVIDQYSWYQIDKRDETLVTQFRKDIQDGRQIGILSEAGCPGIADPGQQLVSIAQEMNAVLKPLVGPSSILLALMASGMNGQQFQFVGYLPVEQQARIKSIRELEIASAKNNCTQIFIETPYRNNHLLDSILKTCATNTRICVAAEITSAKENIKTKTVGEWKKAIPELHKIPVIFLLHASK